MFLADVLVNVVRVAGATSKDDQVHMKNIELKFFKDLFLKLVSAIFYKIFIFSPNDSSFLS